MLSPVRVVSAIFSIAFVVGLGMGNSCHEPPETGFFAKTRFLGYRTGILPVLLLPPFPPDGHLIINRDDAVKKQNSDRSLLIFKYLRAIAHINYINSI